MMYDAYQGMADVGDRVRVLAQNAHAILGAWSAHPTASPWVRMSAYYELVALAGFTHARPDYAIDSVEIRSEKKGVVRLPFSDFRPAQVLCVMEHFDDIKRIIDCNQQCFSGLAMPYEPTDFTGTDDTLAGSPTPPQARD